MERAQRRQEIDNTGLNFHPPGQEHRIRRTRLSDTSYSQCILQMPSRESPNALSTSPQHSWTHSEILLLGCSTLPWIVGLDKSREHIEWPQWSFCSLSG